MNPIAHWIFTIGLAAGGWACLRIVRRLRPTEGRVDRALVTCLGGFMLVGAVCQIILILGVGA